MRNIIKEFIPPIIFKRFRKHGSGVVDKKYSSYQEALKYSDRNAYEEEELIEVIFKKTKAFLQTLKIKPIAVSETAAFSLLAALNPVIERKAERINVLDFGGACGAHYFHLRALIDESLKMNWAVVETPTMVKYAKELESDELTFFDDFKEACNKLKNIDLLHTSGTLQCVDNPGKYLDLILSSDAKWILFNRVGVNKIDRDVITIHTSKLSWNGIGELPEGHTDRWLKYPFIFSSEKRFLNSLQNKYEIVAKFSDRSGMYDVKGEDITGYALLSRLKNNEFVGLSEEHLKFQS